MFIVEVDGVRAGMIHVVGKRQQTYKISPLIVAPEYRGQQGLGSQLLEHAEQYARDQGARQIYCTVAEKNVAAMQFFLRKGFVCAGSSDSHYKSGVTETMLYKPLYGEEEITEFDRQHVSVMSLDDNHKEQVAALLLRELPTSFEGITPEWAQALFAGYDRRDTADINAKYKLIFVAVDGTGNVIGVVAATPKKGNPIKVMPFLASSRAAFEALLVDVPHQMVPYGHKLYIHINPTADEVASLQRHGWTLDAALPSAYRPGIVTQQWSLDIGESTMRSMRVRRRFFDLISSGQKTLEVRVGYDTIKRIQVGERIRLVTHSYHFEVRVNAIRVYHTLEEMLAVEPYERIAPDSTSSEEVLSLLKGIYQPNKERLGVYVFEFQH